MTVMADRCAVRRASALVSVNRVVSFATGASTASPMNAPKKPAIPKCTATAEANEDLGDFGQTNPEACLSEALRFRFPDRRKYPPHPPTYTHARIFASEVTRLELLDVKSILTMKYDWRLPRIPKKVEQVFAMNLHPLKWFAVDGCSSLSKPPIRRRRSKFPLQHEFSVCMCHPVALMPFDLKARA